MRLLSMLLVTAVAVNAQSPLTTTFANNNGNASGGAIYVDLDVLSPTGITLFNLDINTSFATGQIDVYTCPLTYVGNNSNAAVWTQVGTGSFAAGSGVGNPTAVCLASGIFLPTGPVGVAFVQVGNSCAYTSGTGGFQLNYANADLSLTAGGGTNVPFSTTLFSPRVWNGSAYYELGTGVGTCIPGATKAIFGDGCYSSYASCYEVMTAAGIDLAGLKLTATNSPSGYGIAVTAGAGFGVPLGASALTLPDDGQTDTSTVGGTLGIVAGSNCWLALGGGNSNGFAPNVGAFLNNPSEGAYAWTDLQPNLATSGQVYYAETGTVGRLVYNGVFGWNTTGTNDIDIQWDTATGNWSIEFGNLAATNPEDWLVGYSPAGASLDPGAIDIGAGTSTGAADAAGLGLDSNTPSLGGSWDITADSVHASSTAAIFFFGSAEVNPGIDLGFIGAPGCFAYTNADLGIIVEGAVGGSATTSVAVPANNALAGASLTVQATAANGGANAWGVSTSNGLTGVVGL